MKYMYIWKCRQEIGRHFTRPQCVKNAISHCGRVIPFSVGTYIGSSCGIKSLSKLMLIFVNWKKLYAKMQLFFKKLDLKISSVKWRLFCSCPNVSRDSEQQLTIIISARVNDRKNSFQLIFHQCFQPQSILWWAVQTYELARYRIYDEFHSGKCNKLSQNKNTI